MDTSIVRWTSPFIWDNLHSTLEVVLEHNTVGVEIPEGEEGLKMTVDMIQILKFLCLQYTNFIAYLNLCSGEEIFYYTGRQESNFGLTLDIYPTKIKFKEPEKGFTETYAYNEHGTKYIRAGGYILDGNLADNMYDDWLLLKRLGDTLPKPFAKESMMRFSCFGKHRDIGLYYYCNQSEERPTMHNISAVERINASDKVINFLLGSMQQQINRQNNKI